MRDKLNRALRALIYRRVDKEAIDALSELAQADESASHDRTLAIVGAVYLEDALRGAISKHLMPSRLSTTGATIFEDEQAPLQSISARARMAYALGIIDEIQRKDMTIIRSIRNAFAHSSDGFTFKHPDIAAAVGSLEVLKNTNLDDLKAAAPRLFERARFIVAICLHCGILDQYDGKWSGSERYRQALARALLDKSHTPPPLAQDSQSDTLKTRKRRPR